MFTEQQLQHIKDRANYPHDVKPFRKEISRKGTSFNCVYYMTRLGCFLVFSVRRDQKDLAKQAKQEAAFDEKFNEANRLLDQFRQEAGKSSIYPLKQKRCGLCKSIYMATHSDQGDICPSCNAIVESA